MNRSLPSTDGPRRRSPRPRGMRLCAQDPMSYRVARAIQQSSRNSCALLVVYSTVRQEEFWRASIPRTSTLTLRASARQRVVYGNKASRFSTSKYDVLRSTDYAVKTLNKNRNRVTFPYPFSNRRESNTHTSQTRQVILIPSPVRN
jgi:hypothetical protein